MLSQILVVTGMNLKSLPTRRGAALVVIASLAGVVGVMMAVLAMAQGFVRTFVDAGRSDRIVVLRSGEEAGATSVITREQLPALMQAPGLARDSDGQPLAVAEKFIVEVLPKTANGVDANVVIRGVGPKALAVWPEVQLVEGRMFQAGLRELIVGRKAQREFAGLQLGQEVAFGASRWTVVGVFESGGNIHESELWGDVELVLAAFSFLGTYSSITAVVDSEAGAAAYKDAITSNPQLSHTAKPEPEFYAALSADLGRMMRMLGYVVATIMGLGALFSALNTSYAAVKARTVEIATLRAIGFGATPVVISVLIEALALCLVGGLVGGALAYLLFDGYTVSTLNRQSFSQVAFDFRMDWALLGQGLGCAVGFLGALLPALRAARLPVAQALRRS